MFLNVFCRMRFVFHIKSPNILGGIERSVITRCNYLVNHGHEAYILCKDFFDPEDFTIVPIDSRVKVVDYTALMHLPEKPYFEYSLKWLLGKFKVQVFLYDGPVYQSHKARLYHKTPRCFLIRVLLSASPWGEVYRRMVNYY